MKKSLLILFALVATISANAVAPVLYYLVGLENNWTPQEKYQLARNQEALNKDGINEFYITVDLKTTDQFKIVETEDDQVTIKTYFPSGTNNNYGEKGEIQEAGKYTIYFRPEANGNDDWFYKVIYVQKNVETSVEKVKLDVQSQKVLQNGTMYILRNGVRYNLNGAAVK